MLTLLGLGIILTVLAGGASGTVGQLVVELAFVSLAVGLVAGAGAQALQRRADGVPGFTGPSPILVFVALVACLLALSLPVRELERVAGITADSVPSALLGLIVNLALYIGLVALLVVGTGALRWSDILHPRGLWPRRPAPSTLAYEAPRSSRRTALVADVLIGVALAVPLIFASGYLATILFRLLGLSAGDVPDVIPPATNQLDRILTLVAAVVVAPLGEEIFFRGYATNAWARRVRPWSAILRAALFFALVHVLDVTSPGAAVVAFAARIPVAIALSWIYLRRESIYSSLALHSAYNGLLELISLS